MLHYVMKVYRLPGLWFSSWQWNLSMSRRNLVAGHECMMEVSGPQFSLIDSLKPQVTDERQQRMIQRHLDFRAIKDEPPYPLLRTPQRVSIPTLHTSGYVLTVVPFTQLLLSSPQLQSL